MPRGLRTAHQEWPRGPGLWRRWTGAGSDGGCARVSRQRFSTGWLQGLVVGACERVMSMHRSDGQCRPAWRCEELFRWRGGFRDECIPTTCCARGGEAACNRPRPGGGAGAAPRNARPSRPPVPGRRGAGGSSWRGGSAKQPPIRFGATRRRARPQLPYGPRRAQRAGRARNAGARAGATQRASAAGV